MNARSILAVLLPFVACALQWLLWDYIKPYVWFLFFPAAFFSAWLGGLRGGLVGTLIGALLVWYVFIPPSFSLVLDNPAAAFSIVVFVVMGGLFAFFFERLTQAMRRTDEALAETRSANEKITQLYEKTKELDELKSQFFANVSHELRTPLTLIMSPLARRLGAPDLPDACRREDEMMLRNARLLYRHVSDLLDAAKLEAGHMNLEYARFDLGWLARGMAAHFDSLAKEKSIDYRVEAPDNMEAEADAGKLQRILLNLLSNAFKFTPEGGRIVLRLGTEDGQAVFEVQDNGPGVPAELREAVFERFRQVEGGAQRRFGGTGLGLSIVKDFAELHGGAASVADAPGGGAVFTVRLPLRASSGMVGMDAASQLDPVIDYQVVEELRNPASAGASNGVAVAGGDAPLVLVVEDNADMNAFVAEVLRPHYRVAAAFDGREGLERAIALQPELILCDVMMPSMSGDQMVEELRRQPGMSDVPVVMLTAKADDELRIRLLKAGVQEYLNKPFSVEELLARVGGLVATRRRSSAQLHESEGRFAATFEQAAVGMALVAPDGHWLMVNRKLCDIVGYSRDELLTRSFQDITHPDDLDADLDSVHRMLAGEIDSYSMEKRYFHKGGGQVWINITVALVRKPDGTPDYFISAIENIQARKEAEAALRESEANLKEAKRLVGLGHWKWDLRNGSHTWSEEIYRIYGRDPSLSPAVYPEVQQYFTPESWANLAAAVEKSVAEGVPYQCDAEVVRPDGSHGWVTARGEAIRDGGEVAVLHGTVQDITARKLAEDEVLRLNADLERRVAERTAELTSANRELDAFAYAVSHDLRAPLRAMSGFSQALVEDFGDRLEGEAKTYLDQIGIASRKMGELIDGILVLSRSTRGELRRDDIDLSGMAARLLEELARDEPGRRVNCRVEPGLRATGDGRMIEAVMRNLLGNAWKYTAHADMPDIRVYAAEREGIRRYCIADNGAGFDMAHSGRLFQPFQRLHRQDEFPGIGIGLATVQRIVHRHGGGIDAQGEPGKGAIFCFSLSGGSNEEGVKR